MAEQVEQQAQEEGIQNQVEVDFNAQYVLITLNGALLFDSGSADIREDAYPLVDKISKILSQYDKNMIDIEGQTMCQSIIKNMKTMMCCQCIVR